MSATAVAQALRGRFAGRLEVDRSLARFTTYRIGGRASLLAEPADLPDLEALAAALRAEGAALPVLALGRGSNVVISDHGWPGVVVRLATEPFSWIKALEDPDDDRSGLEAGAGRALPLLANWAARRGLAGAEFFVAIPGTVGGAVRMNAGAHGRELSDCLIDVRMFDLQEGEVGRRPAAELDLSYRHSNLTARHLVLGARLHLSPDDPDSIRARMESYRRHRAISQPPAVQNAGSVFRNPPGDHAGRLVEAAGLKGFRVRGASVSTLHANFFVADRGAAAQDVYDLVVEVRRRVRDELGVDLSPEIRFVGAFGPHNSPHGDVETAQEVTW